MQDTYKHSYKIGENLLNSLSVYNVGYQKCEPEYQWGPGVRDHYCIHHILSGSGYYSTGKVSCRLSEGDTFILYPGVELEYRADRDEPWEYAWAGFMGADAASIIRNTGFSRETPYILKGKVPVEEIREGLERIYSVKGNTYEASVAMTGQLYSCLLCSCTIRTGRIRRRISALPMWRRRRAISGQTIPIPLPWRISRITWGSAGATFSGPSRIM